MNNKVFKVVRTYNPNIQSRNWFSIEYNNIVFEKQKNKYYSMTAFDEQTTEYFLNEFVYRKQEFGLLYAYKTFDYINNNLNKMWFKNNLFKIFESECIKANKETDNNNIILCEAIKIEKEYKIE